MREHDNDTDLRKDIEQPTKRKKKVSSYEEAFLSREDKSATEYALNTTTWD